MLLLLPPEEIWRPETPHMGVQKKNSTAENCLQFLKQRSNAVINLGMKHKATTILDCREHTGL
jgi:hypothetical protein